MDADLIAYDLKELQRNHGLSEQTSHGNLENATA